MNRFGTLPVIILWLVVMAPFCFADSGQQASGEQSAGGETAARK